MPTAKRKEKLKSCGNTDKKEEGKKLLKEFENTIAFAELKALSSYSLEHPLSDEQYRRMMELKKKILG